MPGNPAKFPSCPAPSCVSLTKLPPCVSSAADKWLSHFCSKYGRATAFVVTTAGRHQSLIVLALRAQLCLVHQLPPWVVPWVTLTCVRTELADAARLTIWAIIHFQGMTADEPGAPACTCGRVRACRVMFGLRPRLACSWSGPLAAPPAPWRRCVLTNRLGRCSAQIRPQAPHPPGRPPPRAHAPIWDSDLSFLPAIPRSR